MFETDIAAKIKLLAAAFVPMLLGMVCHEVAHGWAAWKRGDPTAKMLGRLTLNPLPHLDVMGSLLFVFTALTSPFILGWAKPVPVNPRYFKSIRRDMALVSVAGPLTNMLVALGFAAALRLLTLALPVEQWGGHGAYDFFLYMFFIGIKVNFMLAWFNLIPIPPLDGGSILAGVLPRSISWHYQKMERYGLLLLVVLLATGVLFPVLSPLVQHSQAFALWLVGLD
jgi:Zn-dependent protease